MTEPTKMIGNPKHIVLHTSATEYNCNKNVINRIHLEKGYLLIGYHFVITGSPFDTGIPQIQQGRRLIYQGAHAYHFNNTIGICVTGHGDVAPWTEYQKYHLKVLVNSLQDIYSIPNENILGHRETPYEDEHHLKTCPGNLIDMNEIRNFLRIT